LEEFAGYSLVHELIHIIENERLKKEYQFKNIHEFMNSIERRHKSEKAAVEAEIMYLIDNYALKLTDFQIEWYIDLMADFQTYTGLELMHVN